MQRRAAFRLVALAVSLLAGAACLSPTLPLPPPEAPDTIRLSADNPDMWVISGSCYPGAMVTLFNDRTRQGVVIEDTDRNGRFSVTIAAERCDLVLISQEVVTDQGIESSPHNSFVIEERDSTGVTGEACP
ncbi:hypothetical protein [Chondromyces crocatus]|uniref:Carboxypeptidase regulatory-like domain-containing protein n=1 Tax=Chondromyces crocatus TaxID=52 RepID=A0A0K1EJL3_CHOCO|nr:hypothetical protein [Chondromyces crocatus]AKT41049.1 uncharacterized protein CMC5_052080 [Chondromyces crocatus]